MGTDKSDETAKLITRRDIMKLSLAAGMGIATGGVINIAHAAHDQRVSVNRPEYARGRFLESMNCSQAILETYGPELGLPVETARRVAAAFAGGMGMGSECGAVTGAFLVIGLKYGKIRDKDPGADDETFKRVATLVKEFKTRHKYLDCSELLGVNMGTPEGVKEAAGKGFFTSRCPNYVKTAAEILERILV